MAYEDYTTYTEVDNANNDITVNGANSVTGNTLTRTDTAYLYDDKGAAFFDDFEHYHDCKPISSTVHSSYAACWGISDTIGDVADWANGICVFVWRTGVTVPQFMLYERGGAGVIDQSINVSWNTRYYLITDRNDTVLTTKIYSDAAHTVLVDTMTGACDTTAYRYIFGIASYDTSSAPYSITMDCYNLDIQEAAGTHTPSDTARASDALIFKAEVPIADTAKASDSLSFFKGLRFSIGDTAKASDDLTFAAEIDIADVAKASDIFASDTPSAIPCECPTFTLNGTSTSILFPKPEWANPNNEISKNVSLFNFWSGDIDTIDKGINTQTLTIGGTVCICGNDDWKNEIAMTTWLDSIKNAMNDGERFTINELGDCLNGVYVIGDFVFNTLKGTSTGFTWSLSLERVKDV